MSDFSDRPFVVGSLTGLRAFNVDKYGRLVAPSQKTVFTPGENVGNCHSSKQMLSGLPEGADVQMSSSWTGSPTVAVTVEGNTYHFSNIGSVASVYPPKDDLDHEVGSVGCGCGFYAYFDGKNDYHASGMGSVEAIIEGYGVCTVGDRGFRASKAKLVALVTPKSLRARPVEAVKEPERESWLKRFFCSWWVWIVLALSNVVVATASAMTGKWWACGTSVVWALSIGVQGGISHRARTKEQSRAKSPGVTVKFSVGEKNDVTKEQWEKVLRAYPNIPVYATRKEALAAHPLTTPDEPTPEDPEFWTRAVS